VTTRGLYSVRSGGSGDRIPVGARFSAPVQTRPGAQTASYTMRDGSFPGVERPGCGVNHPPSPSVEVKEIVHLYIYFSVPSQSVLGWYFTFTVTIGLFVCYLRFLQETAIISVYNIHWFVFIMNVHCVYCDVKIEFLFGRKISFNLHCANMKSVCIL
jgi:hypothetical protein